MSVAKINAITVPRETPRFAERVRGIACQQPGSLRAADGDPLGAHRPHRPVLLVVPNGEGITRPCRLRHAASVWPPPVW